MSENEEKPIQEDVNEAELPKEQESNEEVKASEEGEALEEQESSEPEHNVLSYPERVPNAEKGADHAHSYVMIKVLGFLVIFSLIIAKFTSPF